MRIKKLLPILACLLAFEGKAQIDVSPSLQEAIQKAIDKNASIRNKDLEVEKISTEKKSVWNKYIPKVEGSANYMYFDTNITLDLPTGNIPVINQPIFDGKQSFDSYGNVLMGSLTAKTVLFSGFQIENGAKALEQKRIGTAYLSEAEKENLIKEVIHSFDQVHLLNEVEKLLNDSEKRLATETKRVERAIEEGLAIPYDRDKIKLANLELQSKKIELQGKRKVLYQKINYLTGYSENQIKEVEYLLAPYVISEDLSVENKQELKALESFKKASDYMIKKEKGSCLPVLGAFGASETTAVGGSGIGFCGGAVCAARRTGAGGQPAPMAGRRDGAGRGPGLGPDHGDYPHHPAGGDFTGEAAVLSNWRQRLADARFVATAWGALAHRFQRLCHYLAAAANRGGRICQLPGLDVDAGALPGHQNFGLCLSDTGVCAVVWRAMAG